MDLVSIIHEGKALADQFFAGTPIAAGADAISALADDVKAGSVTGEITDADGLVNVAVPYLEQHFPKNTPEFEAAKGVIAVIGAYLIAKHASAA